MKNQISSMTFLRLTISGMTGSYSDFENLSGLDQPGSAYPGTLILNSGKISGFEILSWLNENIHKKNNSPQPVLIELFASTHEVNFQSKNDDLLKIAAWKLSGAKPLSYTETSKPAASETRSLETLEISYQKLIQIYPVR